MSTATDRAIELVQTLLSEQNAYKAENDTYGADISDPDGWEHTFSVGQRRFTVKIEEE